MVVVLASVGGCATVPSYFTNPQNTQVFGQMGMNCVLAQPQEYAAGVGYSYLKTPIGYQMSQSSLIKVWIQCGAELFTVLCDPTKSAADNPCTGLTIWQPKPAPAGVMGCNPGGN